MTNNGLVQNGFSSEGLDPEVIDALEKEVRETAVMICAEQPDIPEPHSMTDLDSFSFVETLLELENKLERKLMEHLDEFKGKTFRDLAVAIARVQEAQDAAGGKTAEAGSGNS
ncbi:hypothetical protein [Streptomyces sp. NPDC003077]|uniref:hypothetical protein n=1 Tax=Streptomyces sp. NPDC003077 TaxID=3154443 RepID=UPI0033AC52A5